MINSIEYIQNLKPTSRDIYGQKRNLTGYNIYLRYFFKHFELLTYDEKKSLLCDCDVHCSEMYSSDDDSIISTPLASTVDIIKAAAKKWKNMNMNVKNEWKLLARKINILPILGAFGSIPTRITEKDVKTALSRDHYQLISTMSSTLRKRRKISPIDSTLTKKFGKKQFKLVQRYSNHFVCRICLNFAFLVPTIHY